MRAGPDDAIERLGIWLNLQPGEDIPFNRLSRQTGLAWATVVKYAQLIERIAPTLPQVRVGRQGVRVTKQAEACKEIFGDDLTKSAVAVLMHERQGTTVADAKPAFLERGITQLQLLDFFADGKLTTDGKAFAFGALDAVSAKVLESPVGHRSMQETAPWSLRKKMPESIPQAGAAA